MGFVFSLIMFFSRDARCVYLPLDGSKLIDFLNVEIYEFAEIWSSNIHNVNEVTPVTTCGIELDNF